MTATSSYEFSSKPRPVKPRPKFRPEIVAGDGAIVKGDADTKHDPPHYPINIHHDPRVARGNTFAGGRRIDVPPEPRLKPSRRARRALRHGISRNSSSSFFEQTSSQPFPREELDLSRYLIENGEDIARPEQDADTQTDGFEERPQTPDFVPKKTGIDASTQIEVSDKLFDFEAEVQPMLAVLVGKTLEQARIEVEREHELECIREAAEVLTEQREDEARQMAELQQAAVEAEREKNQLRRQKREEANRRRAVKDKVACLQLVRQVLPLSLDRALDELSADSWTTPSVQQIESVFLPWLFEQVSTNADQRSLVRGNLDALLETVDEAAETARIQRIEARHREAEVREQLARREHERVIRLFLPGELAGREEGERLGPITVRAGETVRSVETRVTDWLAEEMGGEELAVPEGGFLNGYLREARRRGGGRHVGRDSSLSELQECLGAPSDEVLLRDTFESPL